MYPTRHAVMRYQQRVAPVSTAEAFRRLAAAGANAHQFDAPRWWNPIASEPGLSYLYPAAMPGVCLVVRDGAIQSVYERAQCQQWEAEQTLFSRRRATRQRRSARAAGTRLELVA